jgi:hypothetical protein
MDELAQARAPWSLVSALSGFSALHLFSLVSPSVFSGVSICFLWCISPSPLVAPGILRPLRPGSAAAAVDDDRTTALAHRRGLRRVQPPHGEPREPPGRGDGRRGARGYRGASSLHGGGRVIYACFLCIETEMGDSHIIVTSGFASRTPLYLSPRMRDATACRGPYVAASPSPVTRESTAAERGPPTGGGERNQFLKNISLDIYIVFLIHQTTTAEAPQQLTQRAANNCARDPAGHAVDRSCLGGPVPQFGN